MHQYAGQLSLTYFNERKEQRGKGRAVGEGVGND